MSRPKVILDDGTSGALVAFGTPRAVIRADHPEEFPPALAAIASAQIAGNFIAGYFSYEGGYLLESRLARRLPAGRPGPLLWFGVFGPPERLPEPQEALKGWQTGRAYAGPLSHEWDAAAYRKRFAAVQDLIAAGDIYQANLTFRSHFAFVGDPLALYARLRGRAQARHGGFVDDGERQIVSLSPELFFAVTPEGAVATRPMKGTAARGGDPAADALARQALAASAKDRAENLMIVDLLRNDLGRIAVQGSVAVSDLFAVETYPTLHQMVSTVTAQLRPGVDAAGVIRALFPCGSVTGAPKIRAMEILSELEQSPRGAYCGAIGYFAPDGSAHFNVAIRTLTIAGNRGELGIGGGVVHDSRAGDEYAEALLKARYYEVARRPLELIETLRWSPQDGLVRGEMHLARMAQSAAVLGLGFDAGRAKAALHAAIPAGAGTALRLRLTLDEAGIFRATSAPLGEGKDVWRYVISPHRVAAADALARHKTNWRDLYEREYAHLPAGRDEVLFLNDRGEVAEGSRTNIFVARDGSLVTPPLSAGALDGVLRRALIAEGRCREAVLQPHDLTDAEVYLGNSLRGLIRAIPA